ncbi:LOW QUALITY PROTEIN: Tyrosine-protein phosphatase non-receptor type 1 [Plecturocebus cupreus]
MIFEGTNLKLTLISEDIKSYYTVQQLELKTLQSKKLERSYISTISHGLTSESQDHSARSVALWWCAAVWASARLGPSVWLIPASCKYQDPSSIDNQETAVRNEKFRMGLIQTADQLCFSYLPVIKGAKFIMGDSSVQDQWKELSHEDLELPPKHVPQPPPQTNPGATPWEMEFFPNPQWVKDETQEDKYCPIKEETGSPLNVVLYSLESMRQDPEVRSGVMKGSLRGAQAAFPAKGELSSPVKKEDHELTLWKPFLVNMCVATVLTAGAYPCYRFLLNSNT